MWRKLKVVLPTEGATPAPPVTKKKQKNKKLRDLGLWWTYCTEACSEKLWMVLSHRSHGTSKLDTIKKTPFREKLSCLSPVALIRSSLARIFDKLTNTGASCENKKSYHHFELSTAYIKSEKNGQITICLLLTTRLNDSSSNCRKSEK